jgi:hypothetical protein
MTLQPSVFTITAAVVRSTIAYSRQNLQEAAISSAQNLDTNGAASNLQDQLVLGPIVAEHKSCTVRKLIFSRYDKI